MSATLVVALTIAILDLTSSKPIDSSLILKLSQNKSAKVQQAKKWAKLIDKISFEEYEDPFLVAAIISVESNFNPDEINSRTGALGLMQIMPASADHILLGWRRAKVDTVPREKVLVPATNLRVGIRILKRYREICNDDLEKTLSAYNGQGCIESDFGKNVKKRWLRAKGFYKPVS